MPIATPFTIPEDPGLAERLRTAAERDTLGTAMVFSGPGDRIRAARFAAAAMQCESEHGKPCGICRACRKIQKDIHPDVVTVVDTEHKNISMDILRGVVADACLLPNEGKRKIYLFPDSGLLEVKAQNILLKVLEDGPPHAVFLLCAENSSLLLPTVRSRLTEWRLSPREMPAPSGEAAEQLCELLCKDSAAAWAAWAARLETGKIERDNLQAILSDARDLVTAGLATCYGVGGSPLSRRLAERVGKRRLAAAAEVLTKFILSCNYNVGVGHLIGALTADLSTKPETKLKTKMDR